MSTLINKLIINKLNDIVSNLHKPKEGNIDKCAPAVERNYFLKCNYSTIGYYIKQ